MMKYSRMALLIGGALLMPAGATAQVSWQWQSAKPGKPVEFPAGSPLDSALLKRVNKDDASHAKRVVIPFFQVQFVTASKKTSEREWASLSQTYALAGLSQSDMQAIADELYDRFAATLTAAGMTVVPIAEARGASPNLAKLLASAKPAPYTGKTSDGTISTIVTAHGLPIYFHISDPERGVFANVGSRAYWDQPAAAKELNAALIGARVAVNFVEQKSSDKRGLFGFRSSTAKVSGAVGLTIEPISTHVWVAGPTRQAGIVGQPVEPTRYFLTSPLVLPAAAITGVDDAKTAGQKRGDVVNSILGTLLSGGFKQDKDAYIVTVDPVVFRRDVGAAMAAVETGLAQQAAASINAAK